MVKVLYFKYFQKPGSQHQRVQMYSSYKSHFTLKYLIACAPSGETTFISRGFGGRTTDFEITTQSGFIDLVEAGDLILADKVKLLFKTMPIIKY